LFNPNRDVVEIQFRGTQSKSIQFEQRLAVEDS